MRSPVLWLAAGAAAVAAGCGGGDDLASAEDARVCFREAGAEVQRVGANAFPQAVEVDDAFSVSFLRVEDQFRHNAFLVVYSPSEDAASAGIRAIKNLARRPAGEPPSRQQWESAYRRYGDAFVFWATEPARTTVALADRCLKGEDD